MQMRLVWNYGRRCFIYQTPRQMCKEAVTDIIYFERAGRRIEMHSRYLGVVRMYCTLAEIYDILNEEGFEYVNQSVIANFHQIINVDGDGVTVADGTRIDFSRTRKQDIMAKLLELWRN